MSTGAIALIVCCLCAALLGFAAHRASVCTVRAVSELISARTSYMLASIGRSALWVVAVTVPALWLLPDAAAAIGGWKLSAAALCGGFVFGLGAALNGGCAYSTMARLADGEVRMALSIGGFALGIVVFVSLVDLQWVGRPAPAPALIGSVLSFALILSLALLVWALYEMRRVWRARPAGARLRDLALAPQYRLSSAAMLIGIAGSVIFLIIGSPGYTITVQNLIERWVGTRGNVPAVRWVLLLAVLTGMALSTWQRGSFRLDWRPQLGWLRNICGGALMGLGTALLPGGNDALVLYGIPSFSPHALPAYLALGIGVAAGLYALKLFGVNSRVVCHNDLYRAEAQPPGSILNGHVPRPPA